MKKHIIITLLALAAFSCSKKEKYPFIQVFGDISTDEFMEYWNSANIALQDSNFIEAENNFANCYAYAPNRPNLMLYYGDILLENDKIEQGAELINRSIRIGSMYTSQLDKQSFPKLRDNSEHQYLLTKIEEQKQPVNNSIIAFQLDQKELIPEGVAYDEQTGRLFISSIYLRKIVAIDQDGTISDFITSSQDKISGVLGMEVDVKRRELWACAVWTGNKSLPKEPMDEYTGVYKFNLETGELINKYLLIDTAERLLNDVVIADDGTAFITESNSGDVFKITPEKDSLELFIDSDYFFYSNGITLSDDNTKLFIAHYATISVMDLETGVINELSHPLDATLCGIDGLAYYKNTLVAHQGTAMGGVFQYKLNEDMDSVVGFRAIEKNHPKFEIPTTGEITGNYYYFIANSQLRKFDNEGNIAPLEELNPVIILKAKLE